MWIEGVKYYVSQHLGRAGDRRGLVALLDEELPRAAVLLKPPGLVDQRQVGDGLEKVPCRTVTEV